MVWADFPKVKICQKKVQIFGTGPKKINKILKKSFLDRPQWVLSESIEKINPPLTKKIAIMLPKPRDCSPKKHCNLAGLQNNPSLISIPSVTSFSEGCQSLREMMRNWSQGLESHMNCTSKLRQVKLRIQEKRWICRESLGWAWWPGFSWETGWDGDVGCRKKLLKILAQPKTCVNDLKTPFLSSFHLSRFRCVIRFPSKNQVPEILNLLTLVVCNCKLKKLEGYFGYFSIG